MAILYSRNKYSVKNISNHLKLVASTVWLIVFSVVVNSGGGCSTVVVVMYTV